MNGMQFNIAVGSIVMGELASHFYNEAQALSASENASDSKARAMSNARASALNGRTSLRAHPIQGGPLDAV
jgi:hypothetical protein